MHMNNAISKASLATYQFSCRHGVRHNGGAGDGDADPDHRQQLRGLLQRVQEAREAGQAQGGARTHQGGGEAETGL